MDQNEIVDKHDNPIHVGDYVFTRIRGGTHEGKVSQSFILILIFIFIFIL